MIKRVRRGQQRMVGLEHFTMARAVTKGDAGNFMQRVSGHHRIEVRVACIGHGILHRRHAAHNLRKLPPGLVLPFAIRGPDPVPCGLLRRRAKL